MSVDSEIAENGVTTGDGLMGIDLPLFVWLFEFAKHLLPTFLRPFFGNALVGLVRKE